MNSKFLKPSESSPKRLSVRVDRYAEVAYKFLKEHGKKNAISEAARFGLIVEAISAGSFDISLIDAIVFDRKRLTTWRNVLLDFEIALQDALDNGTET